MNGIYISLKCKVDLWTSYNPTMKHPCDAPFNYDHLDQQFGSLLRTFN
jgi:hypothetical protein